MGLRITDEFTSPRTPAETIEKVSNDAFRTFITATLDELGRRGLAGGQAPGDNLNFVRVALAASGDEVPSTPRGETMPPAGGCALDSPWADVSLSADGNVLGGSIYWNERQLLRDRAALDGIAPPQSPPTALPRSEFAALARSYSQARMEGRNLPPGAIPTDLLWLFTHAPQSTRGPFEASLSDKMSEIAEASAVFYGSLVAALLEQCRQSKGQTTTIKTITDVRAAIDLERIKTL